MIPRDEQAVNIQNSLEKSTNNARGETPANLLDTALYYARCGWHIFPLRPADKTPLTSHGLHDATTDADTIRGWWGRWPDANIGLNCGASGLLAVDFDIHKEGYAGGALLKQLRAEHLTTAAQTGSGGFHLLYQQPAGNPLGNSRGRLPTGVDVRGVGGYIVTAPSLHPSGNRYTWEVFPAQMTPRPLPDFLLKMLEKPTQTPHTPNNGAQQSGNHGGRFSLAEDIATAQSNLARLATWRVDDRETWITVGMALAQLGDAGLPLWIGWSAQSSKFQPGECEAKWKGFVPGKGVTLATLTHWANEDDPTGARRPFFVDTSGAVELAEEQAKMTMNTDSGDPNAGDGAGQADGDRPHSWPYAMSGGRTYLCKEEADENGNMAIRYIPVADFSAQIVGVVQNEDGAETYQLRGEAARGGPFVCEIAALDFEDNRKLIALLSAAAGPLDPIAAGRANHISSAVKKHTSDSLRWTRCYQRTGWADKHFLIPGRESDGVTVELPRKLVYSIPANGDLSEGIHGLEALLQSIGAEMGTVLLSALFSGPMAKSAGWRNERYAVFVRGRTGTLKTSNAQAAMSIYGPGFLEDVNLTKWGDGATPNALVGMATQAHDLPFLVDNYKPNTGGGERAFVGFVQNVMEGGEKDRMTRSAQLRETKPIFCWPICTGEDVPSGDAASLARMLVIPFSEDNRLPERKAALTVAQQAGAAGHLATVGGAWLDWLEGDKGQATVKQIGAQLNELRNEWATHLEKISPRMANPLRVATNLATNQLAWATVARHPLLGDLARRYTKAHGQGLSTIAAEMAEQTTESSEGERFVVALRELLSTGGALLIDKPADIALSDDLRNLRYVGWPAEDGGAYLLPKIARAAVERLIGDLHVSDQALYDQLEALGHIGQKGKGTRTMLKRLDGKPRRVVHAIKAALFDGLDENDG